MVVKGSARGKEFVRNVSTAVFSVTFLIAVDSSRIPFFLSSVNDVVQNDERENTVVLDDNVNTPEKLEPGPVKHTQQHVQNTTLRGLTGPFFLTTVDYRSTPSPGPFFLLY